MKIYTIERVKCSGKWMEFWFEECAAEGEGRMFDACCKRGTLDELLGPDGGPLHNEILTNGLKGRKMAWVEVSPNLEPLHFVLTTCLPVEQPYISPTEVVRP